MTNEQWNRIEPIIRKLTPPKDPRGRSPRDPRHVFNGILWILRTGAPWKDLPQRYPPYQTCHRRFQQWVRQGVFQRIAQELAEDLYERGQIDIREAFIDGSFAPAKKGVLLSARQSAAKAPRSWPSQTLLVFLSPLTLKALRRTKCNLVARLYYFVFLRWLVMSIFRGRPGIRGIHTEIPVVIYNFKKGYKMYLSI